MNSIEMSRLNSLFEKMVEERANMKEQRELAKLYQEFSNDGRNLSGTLRSVESTERFG